MTTPTPAPHDPQGKPHYYAAGTPPYGAPYGQTAYSGGAESSGIFGSLDLFRLLRVLRKKWLTILLVLIFAGVAAAYYIYTTPKIYRASSLVELSVRRPRLLAQQGAVIEDQGSLQSEEVFNTRLEKFKSRGLMEDTKRRILKQYPQNALTDNEWFGMLRKNLTLTLLRRTRLVKVEFSHTDPQFAADVCRLFSVAAEASVYDENRVSSDAAVAWLEEQSVAKKTELAKADQALLTYRQENKIDALEGQRKTVDESLLSFNKSLVDVESQEAMSRDLLNMIQAVDLQPENSGKVPASIPHGGEIKAALDKWTIAVAERDALRSKYTAKHPEVEAKEKMVALYRSQAFEAMNQAKATAASNLGLLTQQAESLRKKKAEQATLAAELELQIVERRTRLAALERSRDACDSSYRGIVNRIQEARLAADENTATVKIVELPSVPERPVKPVPTLVVALALALGLIGGIGLALVTDTLEDHVAGPNDIEMGVGVKVLAMIPNMPGVKRRDIATASMNQRFSQLAEAFAGLRSMLDSSQYVNCSKVILIASSMPEEGKTITSCNLAIACAKNGQKVLLIDFDLRRPRLVNIFPMPGTGHGLLDFLASSKEGADFAKLTYATDCPNLSAIASRPVHGASPAEQVGSQKVVELLTWARSTFDRVIIDAPPLGLVSDALVLAGLADCVLVMARPEKSRRRAVAHTVQRFREAGVQVIAGVMNDIDFAKGAYYSQYSPYSHYKAYAPDADPKQHEDRA